MTSAIRFRHENGPTTENPDFVFQNEAFAHTGATRTAQRVDGSFAVALTGKGLMRVVSLADARALADALHDAAEAADVLNRSDSNINNNN